MEVPAPARATLPRAVVVHGMADVRAALAPGRPVTLLSGPGAAGYAGAGWWQGMTALARAEARAPLADILDCADSPGWAVDALRAGCRILVLSPDVPAWADVASRAGPLGAVVLAARPAALDLGRRGAARALPGWLAGAGDSIRHFG